MRILSSLAVVAVLALPHAHLTHSTPDANARLTKSPTTIDLSFSETVQVAKTSAVLKDSSGRVVPTGATQRGRSGKNVRIPIKVALQPGLYTVFWKNEALNEHPSSGSFSFRMLKPGDHL